MDWDIVIERVRYDDINGQGRCIPTPTLRFAIIKVRDDSDRTQDTVADYDMESTLVHELLHVAFDAASRKRNGEFNEAGRVGFEQAFAGLVPHLMEAGRVIVRDADGSKFPAVSDLAVRAAGINPSGSKHMAREKRAEFAISGGRFPLNTTGRVKAAPGLAGRSEKAGNISKAQERTIDAKAAAARKKAK